MTEPLRDLEYRFHVDGRSYVVHVCACGAHPQTTTSGPSDVTIYSCERRQLLDHEDDDPDRVARSAIGHVRPYLPGSVDASEWTGFHDAVVAWVMEHRAAEATREHEEDWRAERADLEGTHESH